MYYVIIALWCVDYEEGYSIVGVFTDKAEAVKMLKYRVDTDERLLADEYGYHIYEDSDSCFDAGKEGYYRTEHLYVGIETVPYQRMSVPDNWR